MCSNSSNLDEQADNIFNELDKSDFISIFFLLVDYITPNKFLDIIKNDKNFMAKECKTILHDDPNGVWLIEILGTIKKYSLLKLLGTCRHEYIERAPSFCKLSRFWTFLYEICELMHEKDFECLKTLFPGEVSSDTLCPEILFVKAYQQKIFSENDLTKVSTAFQSKRSDISKRLDDYNDYYPVKRPTKSCPCGLAVIVNHKNFTRRDSDCPSLETRKFSSLDVESLVSLWHIFGFETIVWSDLTDEQVLQKFENLASEDHSAYDVFITCYMSHGDEGVVYASNCKPIEILQLVDIMANYCPTLINKPKLFFIEACQGKKIQRGVLSETYTLPSEPNLLQEAESNLQEAEPNLLQEASAIQVFINPSTTPLRCDVLQVVSSIHGYTSFVPANRNSWFIESLVYNMEKYGHELPVNDIMMKVIERVATKEGPLNISEHKINNCKQTPVIQATMRRKLQLKKIL